MGGWWHVLAACGGAGPAQEPAPDVPPEPDLPSPQRLFQTSPGCEISAAARLSDGTLVLADNEIDDRIGVVHLGTDGLVDTASARWVPIGVEVEDIEALTTDGATLLAVGSFSRNKAGKVQKERSRIARLVWTEGQLVPVHVSDLPDDAEHDRTSPRAALTLQACMARFAPNTEGAPWLCDTIAAGESHVGSSLNVEGAAVLDDHRVWLGLRAPAGHGPALVRVLDLDDDGPRFDGVVHLEVAAPGNRWGVRAMETAGDRLLVVLGPEGDERPEFLLASVPISSIAPGARVAPATVVVIPPGVEGMVVDGADLLLFTDGAKGNADAMACKELPTQLRIPVPQ